MRQLSTLILSTDTSRVDTVLSDDDRATRRCICANSGGQKKSETRQEKSIQFILDHQLIKDTFRQPLDRCVYASLSLSLPLPSHSTSNKQTEVHRHIHRQTQTEHVPIDGDESYSSPRQRVPSIIHRLSMSPCRLFSDYYSNFVRTLSSSSKLEIELANSMIVFFDDQLSLMMKTCR